jgi:hypothetical protein
MLGLLWLCRETTIKKYSYWSGQSSENPIQNLYHTDDFRLKSCIVWLNLKTPLSGSTNQKLPSPIFQNDETTATPLPHHGLRKNDETAPSAIGFIRSTPKGFKGSRVLGVE